jgi:hypothetical protein
VHLDDQRFEPGFEVGGLLQRPRFALLRSLPRVLKALQIRGRCRSG